MSFVFCFLFLSPFDSLIVSDDITGVSTVTQDTVEGVKQKPCSQLLCSSTFYLEKEKGQVFHAKEINTVLYTQLFD